MNNNDYENLDDMLDEVDASMTQYNEEKEYEIYVKNCQNEMKNSVKVFGGNTCGQILETMREPLGIIEIKGPSFTSEDEGTWNYSKQDAYNRSCRWRSSNLIRRVGGEGVYGSDSNYYRSYFSCGMYTALYYKR